jgi:hypothetical protein
MEKTEVIILATSVLFNTVARDKISALEYTAYTPELPINSSR